ncbi:MAG: hypothetical protein K2P95_08885 [Hyphomonadaceae bacterium]|nr:hypothetical protein [Hyphomonadaceae bacterium]
MPDPTAAKPAYRSLTIASALAMLFAYCAERLNIPLSPGVAEQAAQLAIDLIFSLGALGVGVGRARAKGPLQ